MKSVYKKVSVIALSSMIIAGGIASSGINAQAYDPSELKRQVDDLGKGARVYHEVKKIAEKHGAVVEAAFSASVKMNRYVEKHYWDKMQGKSESAKEARKALKDGVECYSNPEKLEWEIEKHPLGNLFRVRYKRYYFLIRIKEYKDISHIPPISSSEIEKNLNRDNQRLYYDHMKDVIEKSGYRVVQMYDENSANKKKMKEYIEDRFIEGVFKGSEEFEEELLVGLHCSDYSAFKFNVEHHYGGKIMRLIYSNIDMLLIRND